MTRNTTDTEPLHRRHRHTLLRVATVVALAALLADLVITIALDGLAYEAHPLAAWASQTFGWAVTAFVSVSVFAALYAYFEYRDDTLVLAGAFAGIPVLVGVVLWNLNIYLTLGMPDVLWANAVETVAPAAAVAGVVVFRRELATVSRLAAGPFSSRQLRAVTLALLMVLWAPAMFTGGIVPQSDSTHGGTAFAESTGVDLAFSGSGDETVKALDVETGDVIWTSTAHSDQVFSVAASPAGDVVFSGSTDNTVKALDTGTGDEIWTSTAHSDNVESLAVSPAGDVVFSGGADDTVKALDAETGDVIWTSTAHSNTVRGLAASPDGDVVFSGARDETVKALDAETGDEIWTSSEHSGTVASVAASPAGDVVFSASRDETVKALDAETGDVIWTSTAHSAGLRTVGASPAGDVVFSGGGDETVKALDAETGDVIWTSTAHSGNVQSVAASRDGDMVFSGSGDETVKALDAETGGEVWTSSEHSAWVTSVSTGGEFGAARAADFSGHVTDSSGDPVEGATVYAADWDAADPPQRDNINFTEYLDDPLLDIDAFDEQLKAMGIDDADVLEAGDMDTTNAWVELFEDRDQSIVAVHDFEEDWQAEGWTTRFAADQPWLLEGGALGMIADDPQLRTASLTYESGDTIAASCWSADDLSSGIISQDGVDQQLPGETEPCEVEVTQLDPFGDTLSTSTYQSVPVYEVFHWSNTGWSSDTGPSVKHHHAALLDLNEGIYTLSPEGSDLQTVVVVSPDGDIDSFKTDLANEFEQLDRQQTEFREWVEEEFDAGNIEFDATTTNETGYYELDISGRVDEVDVRAVKAGFELDVDEEPDIDDLDDIRPATFAEDFEDTIEAEFDDRTTVDFEESAQAFRDGEDDTFQRVCGRMDSLADELGSPFYGSTTATPPTQSADIEGERIVPEDIGEDFQLCTLINVGEEQFEEGLGFLDSGLVDDLEELTLGDKERMFRDIVSLLLANDELAAEFEELTGIEIDSDDPTDYSQGELQIILDRGTQLIDDGTSDAPTGDTDVDDIFDGIDIDDDDDAPSVGDPDDSIDDVENTLSMVWNVGNVDVWEEAGILVRLEWSNGTTTTLNESSEYVEIDDSGLGTDTVSLNEYPIGEDDPEALTARLDIATEDGLGGNEQPGIRNPTFTGDIPATSHIRLSTLKPGPDERVTIAAGGDATFDELARIEVTKPDGTTEEVSTEDVDDLRFTTGDPGSHRVAAIVTNPDGVEFTEVFRIQVGSTARERPPTLKAATGATGRYAIVSDGMQSGSIDVSDGSSQIDIVGVTRDDPREVFIHTTGADIATDATHTIELRVGDEERAIDTSPSVVLHRPKVDEGTLFYRNGRAMPTGEQHPEGEVDLTRNESAVVDTFADAGQLEIRTIEDPGLIQRTFHWLELNSPIPISSPLSILAAGGLVALPAGAVAVRRWSA